MKTYFKNIAVNSYIVINSDEKSIETIFSNTKVKYISLTTDEEFYNHFVNDSTDTSKFEPSDEVTFQNLKMTIASSL
jgi:hypothetical protein